MGNNSFSILTHGLTQNIMQQTSKTPAVHGVYANKQAPWHAGGQRFESAWLHSVIAIELMGDKPLFLFVIGALEQDLA